MADAFRQEVSEKYQKKTQREHLLLRPGMFMGNIHNTTEEMYIFDKDTQKMNLQKVTYNPGIVKMFDEIMMNAADHVQENPGKVKLIRVFADSEKISVYNDGPGIPIIKHQDHDVYIPELIFTQFLTSSNYDDRQRRLKAGMNGLGAKITSTFSILFKITTVYKKEKYTQICEKNLDVIHAPVLCKTNEKDYTCIEFYPDFKRFGTQDISKGTLNVIERRCYDVAAWISDYKVQCHFNDKNVNCSFEEYTSLFCDEFQSKEKILTKNDHFKVAVCSSNNEQFQHISFVNGVHTINGGTHVNFVLQNLIKKLIPRLKKKYKIDSSVSSSVLKENYLREQLFVFVFAKIENPDFKSQSKEECTTKKALLQNTIIQFDDQHLKLVEKMQFVSRFIDLIRLKEKRVLSSGDGKKRKQIIIDKLDDAHKAGTRESYKCTLILTEGDSAKTFAISGIPAMGQEGREYFGIFPLKGKLLNVRNATPKQISNNEEIRNLKQILGLQNSKVYTDIQQLKKEMRYGKICLLTDQDVDAFHIRGLIINYIQYFWPILLTDDTFITCLNTPVIKILPKNKKLPTIPFYTLPSFEEYRANNGPLRHCKIKYYKGLGTSDSREAKECFNNFRKNLIYYAKANENDINYLKMVFDKNQAEERKQWIQKNTGNTKLLDISMLGEGELQRAICLTDFLNKEFVLFSIHDCIRSIPNVVDGLKPSQRKVLYGILKKQSNDEFKLDQIRGYIAEQTVYAHGDMSLNKTIISMAHDYVGSNNINLLFPKGCFGTRLQGGEDSASPRYISTALNPMTREIFLQNDENILMYMNESDTVVEPKYYVPILPMLLVNGSMGIGTGFSCDIPAYNPIDLIKFLRNKMKSKSLDENIKLIPYYRNFKGRIIIENHFESEIFYSEGCFKRQSPTTFEIYELPLKVWTQQYKTFLDKLLEEQVIERYENYSSDTEIQFIIHSSRLQIEQWLKNDQIYKVFKLRNWHRLNFTCFNSNLKLRKYHNVYDCIDDFYYTRIQYYEKRKKYLLDFLENELRDYQVKIRFIQYVIEEKIKIFRQTKELIRDQLLQYNFTEECHVSLMNTPLYHFTQEQIEKLQEKAKQTEEHLKELQQKTSYELWQKDLDSLEISLSSMA